MTTANLISKLNSLGIEYKIVDLNELNKEIAFTIFNQTFYASYNEDKKVIESYYKNIEYDNTNQETVRRFFDNFNQVTNYAIKNKPNVPCEYNPYEDRC